MLEESDIIDQLQEVRARLRNPLASFAELQDVLVRCLEALDLVPTDIPSRNASSSNNGPQRLRLSLKTMDSISKILRSIHEALVETVLPVWSSHLEDDPQAWRLFKQIVSPHPQNQNKSKKPLVDVQHEEIATIVALSSYHAINAVLGQNGTKGFVVEILLKLLDVVVKSYGIKEAYELIFWTGEREALGRYNGEPRARDVKSELQWEEVVKILVAVPARVANAAGAVSEQTGSMANANVPLSLQHRPYFDKLCRDLEELMLDISRRQEYNTFPLEHLLAKLHRTGLLQTPGPAASDSRRPSLFTPMFPALLQHLATADQGEITNAKYPPAFFPTLMGSLPNQVYAALAWSFLLHLTANITVSDSRERPTPSVPPSVEIKAAAANLCAFLGKPDPHNDTWDQLVSEVILARSKGREDVKGMEPRGRVVVAWVGLGGDAAISAFLDRLIEVWTDPKEIKFGLFGRLRYITLLLILTLSLLPFGHPKLVRLAFHGPLLRCMSDFLSHSDPAVRRLGMLVAEIVSQMTVTETEEQRREREQRNAKQNGNKRRKIDPGVDGKATADFEKLMGGLDIDEDGQQTNSAPTAADVPPKMKRLDFGSSMWEGTGEGKEECRYLRAFVGLKDSRADLKNGNEALLGWASSGQSASLSSETADDPMQRASSKATKPEGVREDSRSRSSGSRPSVKKTIDSDDESLVGYSSTSSPSSSRSPSPTPSYLEEIAQDPMLNMRTREKVERPVYIGQLIDLLKAREEPDKLEVGLKWGESLVRRKRDFGRELEENAVELTTMLLGLNDNYDLGGFEDRRQGMLIALTAAVPKLVAPYLAQQYFDGQYSLTQRSAILTALAMGAREAAGMAPVVKADLPRVDFPTKFLPPALHQKYISENDVTHLKASYRLIDAAATDIGTKLLQRKGAEASQKAPPPLARQRQLRVGQPSKTGKIADIGDGAHTLSRPAAAPPLSAISFKDVAAEYFILPLINRFWNYFENELTREARANGAFRAAGTGMILSPMAVAKLLSTLAIMVHASRHSTAFLAIIAPEALELAVMVGQNLKTKPDPPSEANGPREAETEADVLGSALELALVCLDTSKELDGGRTFVIDKMDVLAATGEWAGHLFEQEHEGVTTGANAGGLSEGRTRKAAAGVVVLVSEIVDQSRHLLGWTTS